METQQQPPRLFLRWLKAYCKPEFHIDIEGDLLELYYQRVDDRGARFANRRFRRDVFLLFRPGIIRSPSFRQKLNVLDMLQHALLMALRGFRRQKSTFLINLSGLSMGLAAAFMIYLWVQDEYAVDKYHTQDEQLFLMKEHQLMADGIRTQEGTPPPLARAMADELPEIKAVTNLGWPLDVTLTVGDEHFKAQGRYAGEAVFEVFTIPLVLGEVGDAMKDPST
ncbi:MAG: permease prefix domain 2-containing transporter, partial [Bacteroidota bacterium]